MTPTLEQRIAVYEGAFPQCPGSLHVAGHGRWLYGHFEIGATYANATRYYGAFPRTLPARLAALFFEIPQQHWLHAFSGSVPAGDYLRLDVNPALEPDIVGDVVDAPRLLQPFRRRLRLVVADPPYSAADAERYGVPMVHRATAMRALGAAVQTGTHLAWLDEVQPMYRKDTWHRWGSITILRSGNHRVRELFLFTRV